MSSSSDGGKDDNLRQLSTYPVIPRAQLELKEQLGFGTYGSVHRGIWKSGNKEYTVALKKVFMLEKEVDILSQIRHRNIIQFFGVSHANPDFFIVTEFAENGSLYGYLHNHNAEMGFDRILKWAKDIAQGIAYLHYEAPKTIIHRDLKSKNIVISKNNTCKLCDFGTSKDLTHSWTAASWGGTAAWMSPEIITQKEGITTATDVWSYGVVLWEMISREIPYKGLTEFKIYSIISQHGAKLVIPETCPKPLADLLHGCWLSIPKERIDMKSVILVLEQMQENTELHDQCIIFVNSKEEWRYEIEAQLKELDELKLDLARQREELERREQKLKKIESCIETSQRNLLISQELLTLENVNAWNENEVCDWVKCVAATAGPEVTDAMLDRVVASVLEYDINGARLLQVTDRDLENLDIPTCLRNAIVNKLEELRNTTMNLIEFPTLKVAKILDERSKIDKSRPPFDFPIELHVGMYQRVVHSSVVKYRFKVFVDSDWQHCTLSQSMPREIYDSSTVIKDVCISLVAHDRSVLLESVRCSCPPFGYLEWTDAPLDNMPVTLTCAITYTDQVIQPRNTCIKATIEDFSKPQTVCTKVVSLKIRPFPTDSSISRISSSLFNSAEKVSSSASLKGVWKTRRSSFSMNSASPERSRSMQKTPDSGYVTSTKSPVWADIVASLRKPPLVTRLPSTPSKEDIDKSNDQDEHFEVSMRPRAGSDSLAKAAIYVPRPLMYRPQFAQRKVNHPRLHIGHVERSVESPTHRHKLSLESQESRHASFFLASSPPNNNASRPDSRSPTVGSPSGSGSPETPITPEDLIINAKEQPKRCHNDNCRCRQHISYTHLEPFAEIPVVPPQKRKNRKKFNKKVGLPIKLTSLSPIAQSEEMPASRKNSTNTTQRKSSVVENIPLTPNEANIKKNCSAKFYGGYTNFRRSKKGVDFD